MTTLRGGWSALRLAWRASAGWLAGMAAGMLVAALLPVASVWLLKAVLDALTAGTSPVPGALGLALVSVGMAVVPSVTGYLRAQAGRAVGRHAQSRLYLATARLPGLARVEDPAFRDRLRLASRGGRSAPGSVVDSLLATGQASLTLTGLVLVLTAISPVIAGLTVLGLVPALVAELLLAKARMRMFEGISPIERREQFYAELQTSLTAAKELRLFGLFDLFRGRMLTELTRADRDRGRMDARDMRVQLWLSLLSAGVFGGGLVWAVTAAAHGDLGIGGVSAFVAAVVGLQGGLTALVHQVSALYHALLSYAHYQAVLCTPPDLPLRADPVPVPPLRQGLSLTDVWFRYEPDMPWVLRGVTLHIPAGSAVALVGLNGAGKSTLVKLLCRFYDPQRGSIRWDGVDLRDMSVAELRARIGAVFQDYLTYDLTAAENIGLGDVTALDDRERITAAARRAGIAPALSALPHGYDTLLSRQFADPDHRDSGVLLSGGQWQRLALARTLMRDKRDLLILDEPSSGLDATAEHEIHRRLRAHRAGATSVLISHRLGAVRDADEIVVLSGGTITERGAHDELLTMAGEYATLFRLQSDGYRNAAPEFS